MHLYTQHEFGTLFQFKKPGKFCHVERRNGDESGWVISSRPGIVEVTSEEVIVLVNYCDDLRMESIRTSGKSLDPPANIFMTSDRLFFFVMQSEVESYLERMAYNNNV